MRTASPEDEVDEILGILRTGDVSDFEFVKSLIDTFPHGVDAWLGRRWLTHAIQVTSEKAVSWMIAERVDVNETDDEGFTALANAIYIDGAVSCAMIRILLEAGADVNAFCIRSDWTPLHLAAARKRLDVVELLLNAGANRNIRSLLDDCETAAELATPKIAEFIRNFERFRR